MARAFHIFNTLSRSVEEFRPLNPPQVTFYSCGPTVYLAQHLGNMRAYLFVDFFKRALRFNRYQVRHVMNVTDVGHMTTDAEGGEDKVEKTARAEGKSPREVADFYLGRFLEDLDALGVERPDVLCRATDHIAQMITLVERLVARGYAYVTPSGVYFEVEKFRGAAGTGRLSRQSLAEQESSQRLEHSPDKKSPHDFALWVLNQPGHIMQWDSPWGRGYPGWHIECSAMSMHYLGDTIDIHTGGLDHVPIHHENEIAQSESATGKPFVRYFVHNAFLVGMEGVKISKSAGRFPVLGDVVASGIHPLAFRLFCFGAKYRSELVFSLDALRAAQQNLFYLWGFTSAVSPAEAQSDSPWVESFAEQFIDGLNDDLNTPRALAAMLDLVGEAYRRGDHRVWNALTRFDSVLGLNLQQKFDEAHNLKLPPEVASLIARRKEARQKRDFALSDRLRLELEALGYSAKDRPDGSFEVSRKPK
jgi:cysteinyl-tRNA synthetase